MFIKRYGFTPFMNADGGAGAGGAGTGEGGQGAGEGGQGQGDNGAGGKTQEGAEKTFTQAELEAIVKDRLDRAKRKADEKAENARKEAEREALKEQEKYKELYEALQKDLQAEKENALAVKKQALLVAEGYTKEQAEKYVKFIEGATDEELTTAITAFKEDVPPKGTAYVDPATQGNGQRQEQKHEDPKDFGKSLFARLKASGQIKK